MNVFPKTYEKTIAIRLTEEDYEIVKKLSQSDNLTISDFVRKAIEERKLQKEIEKNLTNMEFDFN